VKIPKIRLGFTFESEFDGKIMPKPCQLTYKRISRNLEKTKRPPVVLFACASPKGVWQTRLFMDEIKYRKA
jgi:hypothetical protein